ncbi:MAG TPA: hypothetical protein VEW94_06570 [Chloroflexia bacterium]|nr:hypothetical protein [Chloroflexia bacterium]
MERVAFLIEETNERIGCLLNPESLTLRRTAGVRPRRSAGGHLTGAGLADDPLLYTGGGRTELELDLLFDVSLAGSSITTDDVRDLTGPLWDLAENATTAEGYGRLSLVRFVWGKSWNMPGVVAAVAERLEQFTESGAPQRSWLRMRLLRVSEPFSGAPASQPLQTLPSALDIAPEELGIPDDSVLVHEIIGGGDDSGGGLGERLDEIAYRFSGHAALWRPIARFNDIADPLDIPAGFLLRIPPASAFGITL